MIFDTDVLIWFFRGDSAAAELIGSRSDRAVSIISWMELVQGARSAEETKIIRRFLRDNDFRVIPVTASAPALAAANEESMEQPSSHTCSAMRWRDANFIDPKLRWFVRVDVVNGGRDPHDGAPTSATAR